MLILIYFRIIRRVYSLPQKLRLIGRFGTTVVKHIPIHTHIPMSDINLHTEEYEYIRTNSNH